MNLKVNYKFSILWIAIFLSLVIRICSEFRGVQEPIPDIEKALGMAAILLSGNLEEEIVKLQGRKQGSAPVTFENVYAELDRGEIILLKPTLQHLPEPNLRRLELKLDTNQVVILAEWKNLTVHASYESYYERGVAFPVRIDGKLSFRWNSIRTKGSIGLFVSENKIQAVNNDIEFIFGSMYLDIVDHNSEHVTEQAVIDACKNIASKLYWDLRWELKASLQTKLNGVLGKYELPELLRSSKDVTFYRDSIEVFTEEANKIVDGYLQAFRSTVIERKIKKVPLKDIVRTVSAKLGIVSLQGDFQALQGTAGDLSTIERVGNFSMWKLKRSEHIQFTGLVQFSDFSASYNYYEAVVGNIKVLGSVHASTISNLAALKIHMIREPSSHFGYNITVESIEIVRLGHINVEVTGMGPLNNFVSLIASMVLNHFKPDLIVEINKNLHYILDTITKGQSPLFQ